MSPEPQMRRCQYVCFQIAGIGGSDEAVFGVLRVHGDEIKPRFVVSSFRPLHIETEDRIVEFLGKHLTAVKESGFLMQELNPRTGHFRTGFLVGNKT